MLHGGERYDKKIDIDFSVSINPLPCPETVKEALKEALSETDKYPDIFQKSFKEAVCRAENAFGNPLSPYNIIGGNGASELLAGIVRMINPREALIAAPSFYGYEHALNMADSCNIRRVGIPLLAPPAIYGRCDEKPKSDGAAFILTEDFADNITDGTDLVIIGNPNNPTGKCIDNKTLISIIERCRNKGCALIVDECFFRLSDYGITGELSDTSASEGGTRSDISAPDNGTCVISARAYIDKYPDLYVIDAYTKLFSIPGVRVGFCISSPDNISRLQKYLPEWNMSVFAQKAGAACARVLSGEPAPDSETISGVTETPSDAKEKKPGVFLRDTIQMIKRERLYLTEKLTSSGFTVYDSDCNFVLFEAPDDLGSRLMERGILIREWDDRFKDYWCPDREKNLKISDNNRLYRIAVINHSQNEALIRAVSEISELSLFDRLR